MRAFGIWTAVCLTPAASAQTLDIVVELDDSRDEVTGRIVATGSDYDADQDVFATAVDLSGSLSSSDGHVNLQLNPGFTNPVLAPLPISGQNTSSVAFWGINFTGIDPLNSPDFDGSNPLLIATFTTTGSVNGMIGGLEIDLINFGVGNLPSGFPGLFEYSTVTIRYVQIPTSGTSGLLGLCGIAAARRRRIGTA